MAPQGGTGEGSQDDYVFIPVPTLQSRIAFLRNPQGGININQITIRSDPNVDQGIVKDEVTKFLLRHHAVTEPDFTVQTQNELISAQEEVNATLSILLGSIAGISLLVGAIGVMNIMIVSVVERTKEIGIMKAIGATNRDVLTLYLMESGFLGLRIRRPGVRILPGAPMKSSRYIPFSTGACCKGRLSATRGHTWCGGRHFYIQHVVCCGPGMRLLQQAHSSLPSATHTTPTRPPHLSHTFSRRESHHDHTGTCARHPAGGSRRCP